MRRAIRASAGGVALFPFLAVLICTMGVLILLLVAALRHSKAAADAPREDANQPTAAELAQAEELATAKADHELRRELLEQSRTATAGQLEEARLVLAHLEDHTRRLEDEYRELAQQALLLANSENALATDRAATQAELARMEQNLQRAKQQLDEARAKAGQQEKFYALVPYDGPSGTRRRPIYIECLADRIVLQPEGVVLSIDDFRPPLDPGNPLASALRATREHHARTTPQGQAVGEPYPLLVVRPDGAETYGMARAAMKSWDAEFGYELVSSELKLKYPTRDPVLAETQQRAVADSRRRRELLALSAPSRYGGENRGAIYRATTRGGFERVETGRGGSRFAGGPAGKSSPGGRDGDGPSGSGQPSRSGLPGGLHRDPHEGEGVGRDPRGATASRNGGSPGTQQQTAGGPSSPPGASASTQSGKPLSGQPGSSSANGSSGGSGGDSSIGSNQPPTSLAASRGSNWGLPGGTTAPTAFRRPIQLQCLADRMILIPETGDRVGVIAINFGQDSTKAVDTLVAAIGKRIEGWGIAGTNSYWKPALEVRVAPDAEARFRDLQILLDDSGIDLVRAAP